MSDASKRLNDFMAGLEGSKRRAVSWLLTILAGLGVWMAYPAVAQILPLFDSESEVMKFLVAFVVGIIVNRELVRKYIEA